MKFWHKFTTSLRQRISRVAAVLLLTFTDPVALACDSAIDLETALKWAGDNRAQIETAIAKVPADQSEGMRFLVLNMPESDLSKLSADFLLENVDYAYRAWNESQWKDRVPKDLFLNYVLPYAVV